jgi:hypothetical protein
MRSTVLALALVLSAQTVAAQQPAKSDSVVRQAQQMQAQMMQSMAPMMQQMAVLSLEGTLKALAKPENAQLLAEFTKNYYDALIKSGFTPEQAIQIVIGVGLPKSAGR